MASAFLTLASQLSHFTGGEDGLSFSVPELLSPSFELMEDPVTTPLGEVYLDGKLISYYLLFLAVTAIFLTILRIVNSPFGRVLQAIRENDFRAEALGYRTVIYRTLVQRALGAVRHAGRLPAGALDSATTAPTRRFRSKS